MNLAETRQKALAAVRDGNLSQAVELFHEAIRQQSSEAELYHELADCHWAAYEFNQALATYGDALRICPESAVTCILAAKKLFGIARFSESVQWLERARGLAPRDASLLAMLAEVHERGNRLSEAEHCAGLALAIEPRHVKAVRIMAHLEMRRGKIEDACQRLQTHLSAHPGLDDWRLRYELASVFDHLGEYTSAMRELLLAKEQLRERALPFLAEAQAVRQRQLELASLLTRQDYESWRDSAVAGHQRRRIGFLCGHPRSGTTLLEQILGMHEHVITTDETGVLGREFIQPILRGSASASDSAAELRSLEPDQIDAGREAYWRCTEAHLGESVRSRLLIEKDPSLTPDLPLPLRLFPEAKVVFPLRDPRDVCLSYFFVLVPLAASSVAALDLRSTCEFCAHSLWFWNHWKQVFPFPLLETRYETLVTNPEKESRRVMDFLDLPWTPSALNFHQRSDSKGIRTPTYADVAQPIYQRAIGRWKNYEEHLQPHLELLQPWLRTFGYD